MGIHVPQRHLSGMMQLKGIFNVAGLTLSQRKNIKKFYERGDVNGESITKTIAYDLWHKYAAKTHPHIDNTWDGLHIKYFSLDHNIWDLSQRYIALARMLPDELWQSWQLSPVRNMLDMYTEVREKAIADNESVMSFQLPALSKYVTDKLDNKCTYTGLEPIIAQIRNTWVAMPEDNQGLQIAEEMISGKREQYALDYMSSNS